MKTHEKFMKKCLDLAIMGLKKTKSNPLVGCVITYNGVILSTGYHKKFGGPHAELDAIQKLKKKHPHDYQELLKKSSLYVNLEPCFHHGKTPPCIDLILKYKIQKVIIGTKDPCNLVNGKSIKELKKHTKLITGVMVRECKILNHQYFINHKLKQPKIILKWAKSTDDFINNDQPGIFKISNSISQKLTHTWRSEIDAIMVGTNTIKCDNKKITTRHIIGKNPIRITIDRFNNNFSDKKWNILNKDAQTIILNEYENKRINNIHYLNYMDCQQDNKLTDQKKLQKIMLLLFNQNIKSILVEGGSIILQNLIDANLWDEARIITSNKIIKKGIKAPTIIHQDKYAKTIKAGNDRIKIITNTNRIFNLE